MEWKNFCIKVDTGAAVNCLSLEEAKHVDPRITESNLKTALNNNHKGMSEETPLTAYTGNPLNLIGIITLKIKCTNETTIQVFWVIKNAKNSLLGQPFIRSTNIMGKMLTTFEMNKDITYDTIYIYDVALRHNKD